MPLTEIKVEIPALSADAADGVLLEEGDVRWSLREDAIAKRAWIVGLFSNAAEARARWHELRPLLAAAPVADPVLRALADRDWRDSYKAHFKAWRFGPLHWVPAWERSRFRLPKGHAVLWLDPGLAFGTGNHETTRLCCRRLVALSRVGTGGPPVRSGPKGRTERTDGRAARPYPQDKRVIDAGCGSGILALSAVRLGFRAVTGFDLDPEAVRVSRENAARNRLAARVRFFAADLAAGLSGRQAEILLANIQADVLIRSARALTGAVAPGGALVLSGILAAERATVRSAFAAAAPGWRINSQVLGEWCDLMLTRPAA